jgi:hypothetical protein
VVTPLPGLIVWTFLCVGLIGCVAVGLAPSESPRALVPVLLLQVFAASSGFSVPSRRGHYDLLLTSGYNRVWIALVHWGASVAPGIVVWLTLAAIEIAASRGARASLLTYGTWVALCLVSTLPWAITVRLPRFAGAIGWLLTLAVSANIWPATHLSHTLSTGAPLDLVLASWTFLVYPPSLVGRDLRLIEALVAAPALVIACASMIAACRWVSRSSIPLEAAQ